MGWWPRIIRSHREAVLQFQVRSWCCLPPADCYSGNIVCQHGKRECDFNLWFTCARKVYKTAQLYMPFVTCMEASYDADTDGPNVAATCAHSAGLAINHLATCFNGKSGIQALAGNAAATPP